MQLIHLKKHFPFIIVLPHSVYDKIKHKQNNFAKLCISLPLHWYIVYGGYVINIMNLDIWGKMIDTQILAS